jgi:hypothetical protein
MAELVAARTAFAVNVGDRTLVVQVGDLFASDDPVVVAHPQFFGPPTVRSSAPTVPSSADEPASAGPERRRRR